MGNSYCSSCECVKSDKQNEFDDTKENPVPIQASTDNKGNKVFSYQNSLASSLQKRPKSDSENGAIVSQWNSSNKANSKSKELANIEFKKQLSLQKRSLIESNPYQNPQNYTPKRDSFVSGFSQSSGALKGSTDSKSQKKNSIQFTIKAVVMIQSSFRAFLVRKAYLSRNSETIKRKYFTLGEFWETLSKQRIYMKHQIREAKEYVYKSSGAKYNGQWKGGFRDGRGSMKWLDGAYFEGEWMDNRAHGFGKFVHANGDVYEGNWKRDKACGLGTYISKLSGGTYKGEWKNDLQHGKGIETWSDQSTYDGDFYLGEKSGFGKQLWPDGSIFIGQWQNNMISGTGRQCWVDNRIYEGEFSNNLMHGFGKFIFSDGKTYEGFYHNDKKHGFGIFSWLNNKRYEGWWTEGKQDGYGILKDGNKKLFGLWKEGQKMKTFNQEEAKLILREYDQVMQKWMIEKDKLEISLDSVQRMTFYSPPDFLTRQNELQKQLEIIDEKFAIEEQLNSKILSSI